MAEIQGLSTGVERPCISAIAKIERTSLFFDSVQFFLFTLSLMETTPKVKKRKKLYF